MSTGHAETRYGALSESFKVAARSEYPGYSPMYERLALGIAEDQEMLALVAGAQKGQWVPNLLFGAVHFLLLKGLQHPLSAFYPSLSGSVESDENPYPHFRAFCQEHRGEIEDLVSTRYLQTNEVGRCACLLPAFGIVAERAQGRPLALIEVGASAGLNLLWDRYGYDYGDAGRYGDLGSLVQVSCELRGGRLPPFPARLPEVEFRVGLDLNPVDVRDFDATQWLRALVWPEDRQRAELLRMAVDVARHEPPRLVAGDAVVTLPDVLKDVPREAALCVFHSHTLNQFSGDQRGRLYSLLSEHASIREVFRVSLEWRWGQPSPQLKVFEHRDGTHTGTLLAYYQAHGKWIEWLEQERRPT